jgi:hypothetical protein
MKILNLKIISPNNQEIRNIKFNKEGLSLIYGDISMPDDKSKTSNSLGKSLLLKFIDYILGANNNDKIVPKVLDGYKLIALVDFENIKYEVIRILGDTKNIFINEEAYELTEYKNFFKIDRTLFRNQIILATRKNLINSYNTKPNREEMLSFLKLIGINPSIIEDTDKIYSIQDEIKNLKKSKEEFLIILDELEEKKIKEQVFYLEKEIKRLEDSLKEIDNKIKNIQITDIKKDIIEEYTRKNIEFKKIEEQIFSNNIEIERMESFIKEYDNIDISTGYILKLYEKAKFEIPSLVKKELTDVEKFHQNIYSDRKKVLKEQIKTLKNQNENKEEKLEDIRKKLNQLGKVISENKIYKENIEIFKNYSKELEDKKYLQGSLSHIVKIDEKITQKDNELDIYFANLRNNFINEKTYINQLQNSLYEFANILYRDDENNKTVNAYFSMSSKKKHQIKRPIDLTINIDYDRGEGVGQVKNNLIDILVLKFNKELDFFIQDSCCYSGIDIRQVSKTLILLNEIAISEKKQAIVSINKFQLYEDEEVKKLVKEKEVITLNENNKLLKFDFK